MKKLALFYLVDAWVRSQERADYAFADFVLFSKILQVQGENPVNILYYLPMPANPTRDLSLEWDGTGL